MKRRYLFAVGVAVVLCILSGRAHGQARCTGGPSDSARAANIVLDTLRRLDTFPSRVFRFSRDSSGFRIVTEPADGRTADGMAIVRLDGRCKVTSIVQTDSA